MPMPHSDVFWACRVFKLVCGWFSDTLNPPMVEAESPKCSILAAFCEVYLFFERFVSEVFLYFLQKICLGKNAGKKIF